MELIATTAVVLVLLGAAAALAALLRDGRRHTPPAQSYQEWSDLDMPSASYTLRIF